MKTRLALVAARGQCEGPWMRARGNERQVRIRSLGEGERIVVDLERKCIPMQPMLLDNDGTFDLPVGWDRLRIMKQCPDDVGPITHVDLMVD